MKFITFIFILLFTSSGFIPTAIIALSYEMEKEMFANISDKQNPDSGDSLPMDCPASEENTESKDAHENTEFPDDLKDLFAHSGMFGLHLPLSKMHGVFVNSFLPSSFFKILLPPPKF